MASATGCALLSPPDAARTTAVLSKMPAEVPRRDARPVTLLVFSPDTSPLYDTTQIAYTLRPYEVAYFSRHQWGETPSQMLQPLLVRTLEATGYFSAVLTPPYAGRYSYALRTEILQLTQDFTSDPAAVQLSLRLRLTDDATGRLVATKEISVREPMQQKTPQAGIAAANEATAKALQQAAQFVLEKTN
jgi:cholesterol transport system auxiliary component